MTNLSLRFFFAFHSNWMDWIRESDGKDLLFNFCFDYICSWRYVYWIWCRWHYAPPQLCPMNRGKHRFGLLRPPWAHRRTWTRWIPCNRVRIMVANSSPCNKVAPDTLQTPIVCPNTHRSLSRIMPFIRNRQHQPADILYPLIRKVCLRLPLDQVQIASGSVFVFCPFEWTIVLHIFSPNRSNASYHAVFAT